MHEGGYRPSLLPLVTWLDQWSMLGGRDLSIE
jgi:hypothetical protein